MRGRGVYLCDCVYMFIPMIMCVICIYLYDYYLAYIVPYIEHEQGTPRQGLSYHPYHDFLPPPLPTLSTTPTLSSGNGRGKSRE